MHHGDKRRAEENVPLGNIFKPGQFGRMFSTLPPLNVPDNALKALGRAMIEAPGNESNPAFDNPTVPAGFTYLGQFIDHDITFDTTPMPELSVDPQAIHNFRTPKLDLDCVYGLGPAAQPYLYARLQDGAPRIEKFLIGTTKPSNDQNQVAVPTGPHDLPRNAEKFALIGDPRNDENLLVAQTHLAILKFHNKIVESGVPNFVEARRKVTWHYQWIVLHDFLRRIVEPSTLSDVLSNGRKFYLFDSEPFIPVEFSVAAYRLGHSMVRHDYDHNRIFGPGDGRLARADLQLLFRFSGLSSNGAAMPLPSNWPIDWRRFYELPRPAGVNMNLSRKLDPLLALDLHNLPISSDPDMKRLSVLNLLRGQRMGLPSGQAVAAFMQLPTLTPQQIASGPDGAVVQTNGLVDNTPLWYYILKEAEVIGNGQRLGPVGSRILSEVFVGLLQGDPNSFLSQSPDWKPELPGATPNDFTMVDLLTFVNDINPVG